jgi:glutamate dehydrogenase (NAD(P)+)
MKSAPPGLVSSVRSKWRRSTSGFLCNQGFGSVGKHAARFLARKGAVLVAASDTRGTIVDEDGLDLPALIALKAEDRALNDYPFGCKFAADAVIDIPCEI